MKLISALFIILILAIAYAQEAEYDPELSMRFLFYSKNSYCSKSTIKNWSCKSCDYNQGTTDAKVFTNLLNGTLGYTAYNPSQNLIVAAFRGSENIQNWIDNLDYVKQEYPFCEDCKVHTGFFRAWNSLADDCLDNIKDLVQKYPTAKILVTGHSLGGAIAELATLGIFQLGLKVDYLYNYGTPRIGNPELAEYAHSLIPGAMRVVHYRDPVPHLPLQSMGFRQVPTEVWYDSKTEAEQYKVCYMPGVEEDPDCSDQEVNLNIGDHTTYLGISTSCNDPFNSEYQEEIQTTAQKMDEMILNAKLNAIITQDQQIIQKQQQESSFF